MTVTCDARANGENAVTYMEFQNGLAGPTPTPTELITANLVCANGAWTFTQAGATREITQVNCALGEENPCDNCPANIVLTPMVVTPTLGPVMMDANGCSTVVATCPASPMGGQTFMQFNGALGGPTGAAGAPVMATLVCANGAFSFTQGGVTTAIMEINCISA